MIRPFPLFPLFAAAVILSGCNNAGAPGEAAPVAAGAEAPRDPMEIEATPFLRERIKIGVPEYREVPQTLTIPATVQADETRIARINSPVAGRIVELNAVEGEQVQRGAVLAVIRSTELSNLQLEFLKALSQRQLAERAVERARRLLEADVIGAAELQRREAELTQATAELSSTRDELRVVGMSEESLARLEKTRNVNSLTQVVATIDGIVLERSVTFGQIVGPSDTLFLLADLSNAWLVADVPEAFAGKLRVGQEVEAEIVALPGNRFRAPLSFVSARVDPETRTVRARTNLPNPSGKFKPAMLATMYLQDRGPKQLTVPSSAVVREGNDDCVFVQTAENTFVLRPVQAGPDADGIRAILSGLREGERVVIEGGFHLNNERRRRSIRGADGGD
jgi:cobalt-zinc-cadmium efflux system membrane fusion protein